MVTSARLDLPILTFEKPLSTFAYQPNLHRNEILEKLLYLNWGKGKD